MDFLKKLIIAVLFGLLSFLSLGLVILWPYWWLVIVAVAVWLFASGWVYFYLYNNFSDLGLLILSELSFFGLIILVEWGFLRWLLLILAGLVVALLFLKLHDIPGKLSLYQKPLRRMKMMLWSFDIYAVFTVLFALNLFFTVIPFWILSLVAGVIAGMVSIMIWKMYFKVGFKQLLLWSALITLSTIELVWVFHLLPLAYLTLGALVAWLWFMMQLFVRFYLGPQGIIWQKQFRFLIANFILFFLILFFVVRWI